MAQALLFGAAHAEQGAWFLRRFIIYSLGFGLLLRACNGVFCQAFFVTLPLISRAASGRDERPLQEESPSVIVG